VVPGRPAVLADRSFIGLFIWTTYHPRSCCGRFEKSEFNSLNRPFSCDHE